MLTKIRTLFKNESGATAIEYTILIALAATVIIGSMTPIRTAVGTIFTNVQTSLTTAATPAQ